MKKLMLLTLATGILSACSSVSVKRDFDTATDFGRLKTFAWQHDEQPETGDPNLDNDLNDQRIRNAVVANLEAKGFQAVGRAEADFLVAYFVDRRRKLSSSSVSIGMGRSRGGRYGGVGYGTEISEYDQAILTIDIVDPADDKTIWRGVGTRSAYTGSNPDKYAKRTSDTVEKILKKFPPKRR